MQMTKKAKSEIEASVGCALNLLPSTVVDKLYAAYQRAVAKMKREQAIEKKYAYPISGNRAKGRFGAILQENKLREQDKKHYQHPTPKIERYRQARHIHDGLVPSIVCSCFRTDTASIPCEIKPDSVVGPLKDYWSKYDK